MAAPTQNDYNVFYSIKDSDKFRILKGYLWRGNTMAEVGSEVFPYEEDRSATEKVSVVTRCYGFGGQNFGVFKRWGIANSLKDSDIKAFVSNFPNGCHYDESGSEMRRFLQQIVNSRLAAEKEQKEIQRAAMEEQRRREAEERRYQDELRRQQAEEERRQREFERKRAEIQKKANAMIEEAERIFSSAKTIDQLKDGIAKYREARNRLIMENNTYSEPGREYVFIESNSFLSACEQVAKHEYKNKRPLECLKYCKYVCNIIDKNYRIDESVLAYTHSLKRTEEFYPEATCIYLISKTYFDANNIDIGIRVAEAGARLGIVACIEMLGDYYADSRDYDGILLSCYYYEMLEDIGDEILHRKKMNSLERVIRIRSREVSEVMEESAPNWLPAPGEGFMSWEKYSNLPDSILNRMDRESKNRNVRYVIIDDSDNFDRFHYVPGQIDLRSLWETYKAAHTVTEKKWLVFEKKQYNGRLKEGDFVECCKFIWETMYLKDSEDLDKGAGQSESSSVTNPAIQKDISEPKAERTNQSSTDNNHAIRSDDSQKERSVQLFSQAIECRKNNDIAGAISYYTESVKLGNAKAANNLGIIYKNGEGVEKDYVKAVSLFADAVSKGNVTAMRNLAKCYLDGTGVEKDFEKSVELLSKAVEIGDIKAGEALVRQYDILEHKDEDKKLYWLKRTADMGSPDCLFELGQYYEKKGDNQDLNQAVECFERAAQKGNVEMKIKVAKAFDQRAWGTEPALDLGRARYWYEEVIQSDDIRLKLEAAKGLDTMYSYDDRVIREALDAEKAYMIYRTLGNLGSREACALAAYCSETGKGTAPNIDIAIFYYEKAGQRELAEWCKKKKKGITRDELFEKHLGCDMSTLDKSAHSQNLEFYNCDVYSNISEFNGRIYYIKHSYGEYAYLCCSDTEGNDVKIVADIDSVFSDSYVHVNDTGIYLYSLKNNDGIIVQHFSIDGLIVSECRDEYEGGYEEGHSVSCLYFYDNKLYYVYNREYESEHECKIKCMHVDDRRVEVVYDKATSISRLFATSDDLIFNARYENESCEQSWADGWMILDIDSGMIECLSNPYCNPENIIYDPDVYDEENPRYNDKSGYDRNIVYIDLCRQIFWTYRYAMEGEDSKHLKRVQYWEPHMLWTDRDSVIKDFPIWRMDSAHFMAGREYFDGIRHYYAENYYEFKSSDREGRVFDWSANNGRHGVCDEFRVVGNHLYLNLAAFDEEQYPLTVEIGNAIRTSWFEDDLPETIIEAYNNVDSCPLVSQQEVAEVKEDASYFNQEDYDGTTAHTVEKTKEENTEHESFVTEDRSNTSEGLSDLVVDKEIGNTDIKYNICTFGSKFHIGFGASVNIRINGKSYSAKTHSKAKGRIDGMKKLYSENGIVLGDRIRAIYHSETNEIELIKLD